MTHTPPVTTMTVDILPLQLDKLSFQINGHTLIDSISTTFDASSRALIMGANGAGKSVLMRLCHGLLQPTGGRLLWRDQQARPTAQAMVFQRPVMLRRSVHENVDYALRLAGLNRAQRDARTHEALATVGLLPLFKRPARTLSGGEQQRLALARAWALRPRILFLDEPTANLDPASSSMIETVIETIAAAGCKIVMTTHNLGQARRLADEIYFIHAGRLLERTPASFFFKAPQTSEASLFIKKELPW